MFDFVDTDGSGSISAPEVAKLLEIMGIPHDKASVRHRPLQLYLSNAAPRAATHSCALCASSTTPTSVASSGRSSGMEGLPVSALNTDSAFER
jgi:hypothetical protein